MKRPLPKRPLPIGISDFKQIRDGNYAYVDKTLFIQELVEKGTKVALIPRMRRSGKTLNLSMLAYFFEKKSIDTSYLFHGLKIWDNPEYRELQGMFPVIFITFKDIKHTSFEKTIEDFSNTISEEFERHRYLLESTVLSDEEKDAYLTILRKKASQPLLEESLQLLIQWLSLYHNQQVFLFIDEYDTPAHAAHIHKYYTPFIEFLINLLSSSLKDNTYLKQGVLSGILRIAKESIFSGLNNVSTFTVLHETFSTAFGLLEPEVIVLLDEYNLSDKILEIKKWYNGYRIGSSTDIYNPWSVLQCIKENGALAPYWVHTSDNALVKQLIIQSKGSFKTDIEELLRGGIIEKKIDEAIVFTDLEKTNASLWSLLLHTGYLTIRSTPSYGVPCQLQIPNIEINELYKSMVFDWFEKTIDEQQYEMLLQSLTSGDIATFSQIFQNFMLSSVSVFDVPFEESEKIYHAFVLGMLLGLESRYTLISNRESGLGRYDVMLIPKDKTALGIIMEFKKSATNNKESMESIADSALLQIEEKQYAQELIHQGIHYILYLAFAFKGKEVFIKHFFKNV